MSSPPKGRRPSGTGGPACSPWCRPLARGTRASTSWCAMLARVPGAELVIAGGPARSQLSKDEAYRHLTSLAERLRRGGPGDVHRQDRGRRPSRAAPLGGPAGERRAVRSVRCDCHRRDGLRHPGRGPAAGACADAVLDGTTGVLVPPGRPDLLARRVRLLLASPLRLEAFGIAAADRATARYSWDRISRETLAAYERCLRPAAASLAGARSG